MGLKLDYDRLIKDYLNYFYIELDVALKAWETEVYSHMNSKYLIKKGAGVNTYIQKTKTRIIAYFEANSAALADAYGTGSLMNEKDNPLFNEYRNNKKLWNQARNGKTIVGRKSGTYVTIFGDKRTSKGTYEEEEIEGKTFNGFKITAIPPSNSIKIANQLLNTYLRQAYKNAINKVKFSNYVIEVK